MKCLNAYGLHAQCSAFVDRTDYAEFLAALEGRLPELLPRFIEKSDTKIIRISTIRTLEGCLTYAETKYAYIVPYMGELSRRKAVSSFFELIPNALGVVTIDAAENYETMFAADHSGEEYGEDLAPAESIEMGFQCCKCAWCGRCEKCDPNMLRKTEPDLPIEVLVKRYSAMKACYEAMPMIREAILSNPALEDKEFCKENRVSVTVSNTLEVTRPAELLARLLVEYPYVDLKTVVEPTRKVLSKLTGIPVGEALNGTLRTKYAAYTEASTQKALRVR